MSQDDVERMIAMAQRVAPGAPGALLAQVVATATQRRPEQPVLAPPRQPAPDRTDDLIAASLAGGMIAASGREWTAEEAVGVWRGVRVILHDS